MYGSFAKGYHRLMRDNGYPEIAGYYEKIFEKYNINPELILDLGCGSGSLTKIMADKGYDMIGIDIELSIEALGEIVGLTVSEEIVDKIFHNFCLGK